MRKIGSLQVNGFTATIYYDDKAETNPFRMYAEYYDIGKDGYLVKHKKLAQKYGDLASCTAYLHNYVLQHNVERF